MFQSKLSRAWCAAALLISVLPWKCAAAPPLTTIQDVLYKADGSRFNGVAVIEWKGFEAADTSVIPTQFFTVQIRNGNLRVQLVPTTNASNSAYYSVQYNSDGKVQFSEIWAVKPSATALRLRDVRVSRAAAGLSIGQVTQSGGPGFVDNEIPSGAVDGSNLSFTLANAPDPASSLALFRNGVLQKQGLDYSLAGSAVSFIPAAAPQNGDVLLASYRLLDPGNPTGAAGGALTGSYPNPDLAASAVFDANVAPAASIIESKLALNHPTHSNAADVRVICSAQGSSTSSQSPAPLGLCRIPPEALAAGARIEIRFDVSHEGSGTGFAAQAFWGSTLLFSRTASAAESWLTGRIDAGILAGSVQWSSQSWGAAAGSAVGAGAASDALASGIVVSLQGQMSGPTSESVTLRNFTVIAYPTR